MRSLSNYDGDVNENSKKSMDLDKKKKTLQVHHALLYASQPLLHDYNVKPSN